MHKRSHRLRRDSNSSRVSVHTSQTRSKRPKSLKKFKDEDGSLDEENPAGPTADRVDIQSEQFDFDLDEDDGGKDICVNESSQPVKISS